MSEYEKFRTWKENLEKDYIKFLKETNQSRQPLFWSGRLAMFLKSYLKSNILSSSKYLKQIEWLLGRYDDEILKGID